MFKFGRSSVDESRRVAKLNAADALRAATHVAATSQFGSTVLLDPERGTYYTLNETGSAVWRYLCAGTTARAIADALCEEFALHSTAWRDQIEHDVLALMTDLYHARLVVRIELVAEST